MSEENTPQMIGDYEFTYESECSDGFPDQIHDAFENSIEVTYDNEPYNGRAQKLVTISNKEVLEKWGDNKEDIRNIKLSFCVI